MGFRRRRSLPVAAAARGESARYNRAVRIAIAVAALLLGCGSPSTPPRTAGGAGGGGPVVKPGARTPAPAGTVAVRDIGCLAPTCAFHAGTSAYFHFGAPCTPESACMYDAAARSYKQCTKPLEGACLTWGAACAPASRCMFDARDALHRTCEAVDGGACKRYGALCAP